MANLIRVHGRGCLLATALLGTVLLAGCPADRAMFFDVSVRVLDSDNHPVDGERVYVIGDSRGLTPEEVPPMQEADFLAVGTTDANGVATFVAHNTEPVGFPTALLVDMILPPYVVFMVMLPDAQTVGYETKFCPAWGTHEGDRIEYRRFDLRTGEYLGGTFSDAGGELDVRIERPPGDPNDAWQESRPAIYVTLRKGSQPLP